MLSIPTTIQVKMDLMVDRLIENNTISSLLVEKAFRTTPRHMFINYLPPRYSKDGKSWSSCEPSQIPDTYLNIIYSETDAILQKCGFRTKSSAPNIMATMLEALELEEGLKVLEIGTGSGYNAALLSAMVGSTGEVFTIERQDNAVKNVLKSLNRMEFSNVKVVCGDGSVGYSTFAPYHRIITTASIYDIPPSWLDQLCDGGIIVAPVWMAPGRMPILKLVKHSNELHGYFIGNSSFMHLQGVDGYNPRKWEVNADKNPVISTILNNPIREDMTPPAQVGDASHRAIQFGEFNMFVNLIEDRAVHLLWPSMGKESWLSLWDPTCMSLVTIWVPDCKIGIYGNDSMYRRLNEIEEMWNQYGTPRISKFKVIVKLGRLNKHCGSMRKKWFVNFRKWSTWKVTIENDIGC